jgi:hypothetical protein
MSGPKRLKWKDVLKTLKSFTPEQLELPAVIMDMNNEDRDNCLIADPHKEQFLAYKNNHWVS